MSLNLGYFNFLLFSYMIFFSSFGGQLGLSVSPNREDISGSIMSITECEEV